MTAERAQQWLDVAKDFFSWMKEADMGGYGIVLGIILGVGIAGGVAFGVYKWQQHRKEDGLNR